jgi:hypothetical protein
MVIGKYREDSWMSRWVDGWIGLNNQGQGRYEENVFVL